jgi:hypothetical protein
MNAPLLEKSRWWSSHQKEVAEHNDEAEQLSREQHDPAVPRY